MGDPETQVVLPLMDSDLVEAYRGFFKWWTFFFWFKVEKSSLLLCSSSIRRISKKVWKKALK